MPARPVPVNATAAAILGLLHDGPLTGGELVAAAGERFGGFFSVTRSQVYRELPALAEAGLLRLGKLGPRASQQYRINAAGKRSFRAWLAGPGGADALRSPLVLRLLYAGSLSVDDRAKLLATSRSANASPCGLPYRFDTCISVAAWSAIAFTRCGWPCPSALTAIPAAKSRYCSSFSPYR